MLKGANIVFDLDGTLVDTAPDLTSALNHALTRRGHLAVSAATVRSAVGLGIRVMIEETLRRLGASDDVDEMLAEFLAYYEANIARESRPFPGVVAVLERLAAEGATLAASRNVSAAYFSKSLISNTISLRSRDVILSQCQNRIPVISSAPSRLPAAIRPTLS
jgi:phosphoglycolate phosphatase